MAVFGLSIEGRVVRTGTLYQSMMTAQGVLFHKEEGQESPLVSLFASRCHIVNQ